MGHREAAAGDVVEEVPLLALFEHHISLLRLDHLGVGEALGGLFRCVCTVLHRQGHLVSLIVIGKVAAEDLRHLDPPAVVGQGIITVRLLPGFGHIETITLVTDHKDALLPVALPGKEYPLCGNLRILALLHHQIHHTLPRFHPRTLFIVGDAAVAVLNGVYNQFRQGELQPHLILRFKEAGLYQVGHRDTGVDRHRQGVVLDKKGAAHLLHQPVGDLPLED